MRAQSSSSKQGELIRSFFTQISICIFQIDLSNSSEAPAQTDKAFQGDFVQQRLDFNFIKCNYIQGVSALCNLLKKAATPDFLMMTAGRTKAAFPPQQAQQILASAENKTC